MIGFAQGERFAKLDADDRERLEALSKLDEFADGDEIVSATHPYPFIAVVVTGAVEMVIAGPSGDVSLGTLRAGDFFGELDAEKELGALRFVARGPTIVRAVPKNPLKHELLSHRTFATQLLFAYNRAISEKLRLVTAASLQVEAGAVRMPDGSVLTRPSIRPGDAQASHLSPEEAGWLEVMGRRIEFADGESIIREGDTTREFYVIDEGTAEVRKRSGADGAEAVVVRLRVRDLVGLLGFVDGNPRSASVVAVRGPLICTRIEPDALERALKVNFNAAFRFFGTMRVVLGRMFRDTSARISVQLAGDG
jgi:CRP-like cAMP-binding protein